MSDRRYNGDTMNNNSAAQCGEMRQIGKRKEFLWHLSPAFVPVHGYPHLQPGSGMSILARTLLSPKHGRIERGNSKYGEGR
jgi:hypothetical protein